MFDDEVLDNDNLNMKCDVTVENGFYHIDIDIPGFSKENLKVEYINGYLVVACKRLDTKENDKKYYVRRERFYGEYKRSFYIGEVDSNKINAKYKDGVLSLIVPKIEVNQGKNIDIK